jgi:uncharacterized protein (DUF58 family)
MIRPTRTAVLVFGALLPAPWLLLAFSPALWLLSFNLSALVLVTIAVDALLVCPARRVAVRFQAPPATCIGDGIDARVEVETARRQGPASFEVTLELAGDAEPEVPRNPFLLHRSSPQALRISTRRRGIAQVVALWVRWQGPLQLIEQVRRFELNCSTAVRPNIQAARSAALAFLSRDALLGAKLQPEKGQGSEFEALREYAPGFDTRQIDWKQSARHRKLLAKELRAERNHPIVLAFDTGRLMREPLGGVTRLDHCINAGLLLGWMAIQAGDLVGLCAFDARLRQLYAPARGLQTFRHLQQRSASLAYSEEETNFTIGLSELGAQLQRRSLIILFTEFVDTVTAGLLLEHLERAARRHLVVFVTLRDSHPEEMLDAEPLDLAQIARTVLAEDFERDRTIVLEKLRRMGIHCIDVRPERLSPALINRYLLIKQRSLL